MNSPSRRHFLASTGALAAATLRADSQEAAPAPLRYRLGIVTYNIAATWDMPTLLRICRGVGLSPVELRTGHRHGVEPSLSPEDPREVRQQFADAGVEIWGCGSTCEFHSPDRDVVQRNIETCRQFIRLAADIGGKGVKVRPNALPRGVPVERTLEQIGRSLNECGRAARDAGVEVWLEVHGTDTAHPPHIATIMRACDHPSVGVTWNSNATDVTNGSVAESFRLLRRWIKSCHINELHSGYPYRELFRLLRETGYDRVTLAEIAGMPDPASGERLMRYYKALWTELTRVALLRESASVKLHGLSSPLAGPTRAAEKLLEWEAPKTRNNLSRSRSLNVQMAEGFDDYLRYLHETVRSRMTIYFSGCKLIVKIL